MTDTVALVVTLGLAALLLIAGLLAARLWMRLRALRQAYKEVGARHDSLVNLIGAAALQKGGTLRVICREPNFSVPGINIERKGNAYAITVQGGPHV